MDLENTIGEYSKISVVLPAYQEAKRIGDTIKHWSAYLDENFPGTEVIVVCDGCTDDTAQVALNNFTSTKCTIKVLDLPVNQGKGMAVKEGILNATGDTVVFTDSDMSYQPDVLPLFLDKIKSGADVAIAQRQKDEKYPGMGRRMVAVISRFVIGNLVLPGIRDTQAGFKAFKKDVAVELFSAMTIKRFLFDLEILVIAKQRNYQIEKVYVPWQDREGSTVRICLDTSRAARDLMIIITRKWCGFYNK